MDFFTATLILLLVLCLGGIVGLCLFAPWFRHWKAGQPFSAWIAVWLAGWALQIIGWGIYFLTYRQMDENPAPIDFSQSVICAGLLLWIIAFSLYRKIRWPGLIIVSGVLAAVAVVPVIIHLQYTTPPSDDVLIAKFHQHELEFNRLLRMTQTDRKLDSVGNDWSYPDDLSGTGISQKRIDQYRVLFRAMGITNCTPSEDRGEITLGVWGIGNALSSDANKGYVYRTTPPEALSESLDHCQYDGRKDTEVFRHIQGNWYLFFEYIPG